MSIRQQTGQLLLKVSSGLGDYKPLGIPREDFISLDEQLRVKLFKDTFSTNQGKNGFYLEINPKDGILNYVSQSIISNSFKDNEGRLQSRYILGDGIHYKENNNDSFSGHRKASAIEQFISTLFWGTSNELNNKFDERFTSDFINEKAESNKYQYVRNEVEEKFQLISNDLKHSDSSNFNDIIDIEDNKCKYMPLNDVNKRKLIATLHNVLNDNKNDAKYLFFVTDSRPESDDKVEKIHSFYAPVENGERVKILVLSSKVDAEYCVDLKKKSLPFPTKVGIAVVTMGLIMASLLIWLMPSPSPKTDSTKLEADSIISVTQSENGCVNEIMKSEFLSPGTYTDGNLTLKVSDTLLQMYDANDSLIQSFIFRLDSVKKIEE